MAWCNRLLMIEAGSRLCSSAAVSAAILSISCWKPFSSSFGHWLTLPAMVSSLMTRHDEHYSPWAHHIHTAADQQLRFTAFTDNAFSSGELSFGVMGKTSL